MQTEKEKIELLKKIILALLYMNDGKMEKEKLKAMAYLTFHIINKKD